MRLLRFALGLPEVVRRIHFPVVFVKLQVADRSWAVIRTREARVFYPSRNVCKAFGRKTRRFVPAKLYFYFLSNLRTQGYTSILAFAQVPV